MTTPELEKSVKGFCRWLVWKLAFLVYLLCIALPTGSCITTLLIVGIKRDSSELMPIFMTVLLHPIATIPFGMCAKVMGKVVSDKVFERLPETTLVQVIRRLLTYSLNVHLTLIAGVTYFLFSLWSIFQNSTTVIFSNKSFNQCLCDILPEYYNGEECVNTETQNSFQNKFLYLQTSHFLIAFLSVSISCHVIHSLLIWLPEPQTLLDFIIGSNKEEVHEEAAPETANSEPTISNHPNPRRKSPATIFKLICCFSAVLYFIGLMTSPFYAFDLYVANGKAWPDV